MAQYQQSGTKTFGDIELEDFTWEIREVKYNCITLEMVVSIDAWEIHAKHNRTFSIDMPENPDIDSVTAKVLELETFAGSTLIQ